MHANTYTCTHAVTHANLQLTVGVKSQTPSGPNFFHHESTKGYIRLHDAFLVQKMTTCLGSLGLHFMQGVQLVQAPSPPASEPGFFKLLISKGSEIWKRCRRRATEKCGTKANSLNWPSNAPRVVLIQPDTGHQ